MGTVVALAKNQRTRRRPGFVYFLRCADMVKIGFSRDPDIRAKTLNAMSPMGLEIVGLHAGTRVDEAALHLKFAAHRRHAEWFSWCDEISDVAQNGFAPSSEIDSARETDEAVVGAILMPVFRRLFPYKSAAELQLRTGYSPRMCEYLLSLRHEMSSQALAALVVSDIGEEIVSALRSAKSNFVR